MNDYLAFLEEVGLKEEQMQPNGDFIPNESPRVEFRPSAIHGIGMFSRASHQPGQFIADARIGGRWTEAGRFTNHAAVANMQAIGNANYLQFIATALISPGDELTVNYRSVRAAIFNQ